MATDKPEGTKSRPPTRDSERRKLRGKRRVAAKVNWHGDRDASGTKADVEAFGLLLNREAVLCLPYLGLLHTR